MNRKHISLILSLLIIFNLGMINVFAAKDGLLDFAVDGGNIQYDPTKGEIVSADKTITSAVIPSEIDGVKIVAVAFEAFKDCTELTKVVLPDSIMTMKNGTFTGCTKLFDVTLPANITEIGGWTFYQCSSLDNVTIPKNLKMISNTMFGSSGLKSVIIPDGVEKIEIYAFSDCKNLETVSIPKSVTIIGGGAFQGDKAIKDIFYDGTQADWGKVSIDNLISANKYLIDGNIHFKTDTSGSISFDDVLEGDYFVKEVKWAVERGITVGTGDNKFSPNVECTRAQIITFIWRAYGSPEPSGEYNKYMEGVDSSEYYYKAVIWMAEKGMLEGLDIAAANPLLDSPCTRALAVTFLYRAVGCPAFKEDAKFEDVSSDVYYKDAISWAVENEVTFGVGNHQFAPNNTCTRAQIACFLYRTLVPKGS